MEVKDVDLPKAMKQSMLGLNLASKRDRCGTDCRWGDSQPDLPPDGAGVIAVGEVKEALRNEGNPN